MKRYALVSVLCLTASAALAQMGEPMAKFIEQWNADGDGQVTLAEGHEKRAAVFDMFDQSADGVLDAAEWALVDEHVMLELGPGPGAGMGNGQGMGQGKGQGKNGPGAAIHDSLTPAYNDANADGRVTREEFVAATDRLFQLLDRTGDGIITKDDFGPG
jgi:Ca2+-binding EF-hand superfamily protein